MLRNLPGNIIILLLLLAVLAGVSQYPHARIQAATPEGTVLAMINPAEGTYDVDETILVSLSIQPKGEAAPRISGVALSVYYQYSDDAPPLLTSTPDITIAPEITQNNWECLNKDIREEENTFGVIISCVYLADAKEGFLLGRELPVADFRLKIESEPAVNPVVLKFDGNWSGVSDPSGEDDLLAAPLPEAVYQIKFAGEPPPPPPPEEGVVSLVRGWNKVILGRRVPELSVAQVLTDINDQCGPGTARAASRRQNGVWQSFVPGFGGVPFDFSARQEGYLLLENNCLWEVLP